MVCEYIRQCEALSKADTKQRSEIIQRFGEENYIPEIVMGNFCTGLCYHPSSEIDCRIRKMFCGFSEQFCDESFGIDASLSIYSPASAQAAIETAVSGR